MSLSLALLLSSSNYDVLITEQGAEKDQGQAFHPVQRLHPGGKPSHDDGHDVGHDGHGDDFDRHGDDYDRRGDGHYGHGYGLNDRRVMQPQIQGSGLHLWSWGRNLDWLVQHWTGSPLKMGYMNFTSMMIKN